MADRPRILVVDDNHDLRENIAECLEQEGYQVLVAGDGHGALAHLEAGPLPAVAIIDVVMPGMDGRELVRRIRRDPRFAGLRLVLATGQSPAQPAPGADAVLQKPFGVTALVETVRALSGAAVEPS